VNHSIDQATVSIDPSSGFELNGKLSNATKNARLFSLYLAMQQTALADTIGIESPTASTPDVETQLRSLNFYRHPALSADDSHWDTLNRVSQAFSQHQFADARLHLAMHPMPLAQVDNAQKISDDIVNNCPLGAQKRLSKQYSSTLYEDNTLMEEVILNAKQAVAA